MKLYIYPTILLKKENNYNPYLENLGESLNNYFDFINYRKEGTIALFHLFKNLFNMDICVFNWIENIPFKKMGVLQYYFFIFIILPLLNMRKVKLIWIMHNIESHQGANRFSTLIFDRMIRSSYVFITHSQEAKNQILKYRKSEDVFFAHHPINYQHNNQSIEIKERKYKYDILIWGKISRYKGVVEFLSFLSENSYNKSYQIKIVGLCDDSFLINEIEKYLNDYITYENRSAAFDEINELISVSKFVLFPYNSKSISSSGVLMDSLSCLGSCIGPNKGAFRDLANKDLCYVFNDYFDVIKILNRGLQIDFSKIKYWVGQNSWNSFGANFSFFLNQKLNNSDSYGK